MPPRACLLTLGGDLRCLAVAGAATAPRTPALPHRKPGTLWSGAEDKADKTHAHARSVVTSVRLFSCGFCLSQASLGIGKGSFYHHHEHGVAHTKFQNRRSRCFLPFFVSVAPNPAVEFWKSCDMTAAGKEYGVRNRVSRNRTPPLGALSSYRPLNARETKRNEKETTRHDTTRNEKKRKDPFALESSLLQKCV